MKSMNDYRNNKPHDPHGFKEEVKIKYDAVKAVSGRFPNRIVTMMKLLGAERLVLDLVVYFAMPPTDQLI